jgi:hypothetical protein
MKAIAIKMRTYVVGVNIVDNNDLNKRVLHAMLLALGVLALSYVLILGSMVFNIVERRALEVSARTLSNEVGELELSYLSASKEVDIAYAQSLGFKETKAKFATRKPSIHNSLGSIKATNNEL